MGWYTARLAGKYDEAQDAEAAERERQRMLTWRPSPPTKEDLHVRRDMILTARFGFAAGPYLAIGSPCAFCDARTTHYEWISHGRAGGHGAWTCAAHAGPGACLLPTLPPDVRERLEQAGCLPEGV